jgi:hypothetical protein
MPKKKTGVRKIALELRLPEERYATEGVSLTIRRKASARTLPDAICEAVRAAFDDPAMERKEPAYISLTIVLTSRWNFDHLTNVDQQAAEDALLDRATKPSKRWDET